MKGWLFTKAFVEPKLIEKEDPKAVPGEVVIDIKACGLCHSDVGFLESQEMADAYVKAAPCIFGHECAGIVSEVGEGVTTLKVGDRVGVVPQSPANPYEIIGCTRDGGYATKILVPADQCLILPENVSFIQGAVGTDAGATSHHALFVVGQAKAGMKVGILGFGGLGQFATQMALIAGCEVYVSTRKAEAQELARSFGVNGVVSNITELTDKDLDLIIDFAGFDSTLTGAVSTVRNGGTVVLVGLGQSGGKVGFMIDDLVSRGIQVKGSFGNTWEDVKGVYEYFATGRLTPQITLVKFDEIGEGLELLKKGGVKGRLAATVEE